MGDKNPPPVLGSAAYPIPRPGMGRARGRARALPLTQEQRDSLVMPGTRPVQGVQGVTGRGRGVTPPDLGRGRGVTPEREAARARGVTPERQEPDIASGRAIHRGAGVALRPSTASGSALSVSSKAVSSQASEPALESGVSALTIGSGSDGKNGQSSAGRGTTRGRRDRADDMLVRTRPNDMESKIGKGGKPIQVTTNYFELITKTGWRLYKYRVDMAPEVDHTGTRKALLYTHEAALPAACFDGTLMYTKDRLTQDPMVLQSTMREGTVVTLSIRLVEELLPTDWHYTQFFSIVLRKCMEGMQMQLIGRNYYDPGATVQLKQHKLELWPGYVTSIRQHENSMMLCCEISHKVLRMDTVLEQIAVITSRNKTNYRSAVEKELLGQVVMTRYNNATYRIDDIAWDQHPTDSFEGRKGTQMTFIEYYQNKYQKTIKDGKQPLLVSKPTLKNMRAGGDSLILLLPELCNMTGLNDEQRADFNLMKAVGEHTRQDPEKRTRELTRFAQRLKSKPEIQAELGRWDMEFAEALSSFRARILDPENILGAGSSKQTYSSDNADWSAAFRNWKQTSVVKVTKWVVLHPPRTGDQTKEFIACCKKIGPSLGMSMSPPKVFETVDQRPSTYVQDLNKVMELQPQLVMIVIPNNKGDHYAAVKQICCLEKPVPSQVMTATVLGKPKGLMSVATKVLVQMNCKLGGEPWTVEIPLKNTMVLGYDTYHDSLHKDKSVGALVASLNKTFTKFISSVEFHSNQSELTDKMTPGIAKALRKYKEINGIFPDRVMMYRDGVGDGQIQYVLEHEVGAIEACFREAGMEGVKFTYVIVSKRINTRFFRMNGKPSNPPSGTVVDDVVTLPERYDFFLVSQSVRQGTVNPTSYNVVRDTSGLKPEHLQKLTYKLTHLYYNWPGTVRVPAPCQYAHKLALLVGDSLHKVPSNKLDDLLYYL